MAEHDLGAAAYAIKAAAASRPADDRARAAERDWQRGQLPHEVRSLVLEDQSSRNELCWSVFSLPGAAITPTSRPPCRWRAPIGSRAG